MRLGIWTGVFLVGLMGWTAHAGTVAADRLVAFESSKVNGSLTVFGDSLPTNRPELSYSFDEPASGGSVEDESIHGNDGVLYGTTWTSDVPAGLTGGSFNFPNGTGHYIDVSFGSGLQFSGPFSIAAWIKPTVSGNDYGIVVKGATTSGIEYGLGWGSGNVGLYSSGGNNYMWTTNTPAPVGSWTHVAGVLEAGGVAKLYVNGVLARQSTLSMPTAGSGKLYVGRWRDDIYFKGLIDEPEMFRRALTAEEVGAIYSNTWGWVTTTNVLMQADTNGVAIKRLIQQGDVGMGVYVNGP